MKGEIEKHLEEFKVHWRTQRIPIIRDSALSPKDSEIKELELEIARLEFLIYHQPYKHDRLKVEEEIGKVKGELSDALSQAKENYREKQNIRHARILHSIAEGITGVLGIITKKIWP